MTYFNAPINWHSPSTLDVAISALSLLISWILFRSRQQKESKLQGSDHETLWTMPAGDKPDVVHSTTPMGWILPSYIHHSRMLPKTSTHTFRYPTLYLCVPLQALEQGQCNLGWKNRLFRWNGNGQKLPRKLSLTALEAIDYLGSEEEESLLAKLEGELRKRGFFDQQDDSILTKPDSHFEVWAITMPSLAGMHGINPLTTYYIYHRDKDGRRGSLWVCLLEVHNTFSERHLYVLPAGRGEDEELDSNDAQSHTTETGPSGDGLSWKVERRRPAYDHQWTFPRSFHVSPFNDRGGYYRLYLKTLFADGESMPTMDIRLLLLVPDEEVPARLEINPEEASASIPSSIANQTKQPFLVKKLLATLSSHPSSSRQRPIPLTSRNLLLSLSRQPFDLSLTFIRIVWQAAKLHYSKKLDVFGKPDMTIRGALKDAAPKTNVDVGDWDGIGWPISSNATQIERTSRNPTDIDSDSLPVNGSLYWPEPTFIDEAFRDRFLRVARRSRSISLRLISSNGHIETVPSMEETVLELKIYMMSPTFYTDVHLYSYSQLAVLMGSQIGRRWGVNDVELFHRFFRELQLPIAGQSDQKQLNQIRTIRRNHYKWAHGLAGVSSPTLDTFLKPVARSEETSVLDLAEPYTSNEVWSLQLTHWTAIAGEKVFRWVRARYTKGTEPWLEWHRGLELHHRASQGTNTNSAVT